MNKNKHIELEQREGGRLGEWRGVEGRGGEGWEVSGSWREGGRERENDIGCAEWQTFNMDN